MPGIAASFWWCGADPGPAGHRTLREWQASRDTMFVTKPCRHQGKEAMLASVTDAFVIQAWTRRTWIGPITWVLYASDVPYGIRVEPLQTADDEDREVGEDNPIAVLIGIHEGLVNTPDDLLLRIMTSLVEQAAWIHEHPHADPDCDAIWSCTARDLIRGMVTPDQVMTHWDALCE